jgi:serine phosphatase RsbU (regulator of sigma subunit)/pSer/pThr/pTyr-binding forkhead associated (FHA) protein
MSDAWFEVIEGTERRQVAIEKDSFTIGRRTGNDLRLDGADVSREHAVVARNGDQYVLRDSKSRFGTFVNGAQISEKVLGSGDRVRLGQSGGVEIVFLSGEGLVRRSSGRSSDSQMQTSAGGDIRLVAMLLEGLRALGSARVLDDVLALVIDSATELSGAERGFIMLAGADGRLEFKLARAKGRVTLSGRSFETGGKVSYETSVKIPEEVFRTGKAKVVLDLLDGDGAAVHVGTIALGIRHVFCVPLRLVHFIERADSPPEEKRIGVLYLDSRERGALATQATQAGLETLANEAAVAIQNARLYREAMEKAKIEQELKIAAEIQQSLLPPPAWSSDYFDAIGTTVPCRAIGGDFFEYLTMVDGSAGFVVADVSGKGAPAALLTAVTQGVLATQTSFGGGPAAALARVNEILIRRAVASRFVTIFFAAMSREGKLTFCNGGHNPPFLVSGTTVRRLETGGLICGLFEKATYEEETVQLQPGDVLVMFSDGVSEALNAAGEEFGDPRILECVQRNAQGDPTRVLDCLVHTVRAFAAGTVQSDDLTAVIVRYGGRA